MLRLRCKHLMKTSTDVRETYEQILRSHDDIDSLMSRYGYTKEEIADTFDRENIEFGIIAASNLPTGEPVMVLVVLRGESLLFDLTVPDYSEHVQNSSEHTQNSSEYTQNSSGHIKSCCTELISLEAFALLHKYVYNNSRALLEVAVGQHFNHNRLIEFGTLVKKCYSLAQSDTQDSPVYPQQLAMIESFICRNITKSARN